MNLVKSPAEIIKIADACRIASCVLSDLSGYIKPGISTRELDEIGEGLVLKFGALPAFKGYRGYKYATCISVNEEVVHGLPGIRKLKEGDVVGVDVGTILDGYFGDVAATYPVGNVSAKAEKLLNCGREALKLAIEKARAHNHVGDISHAIEQRAKKDNFSVVCDLFGHGVGKNLHEDPLIPNFGNPGEGPELLTGMVIAIEPMVNLGGSRIVTLDDGWTVITYDHSLSVHFEHSVLITEGEPEILTYVK